MPKKNGQQGYNGRVTFASTRSVLDFPDFLAVQLQSFNDFVQGDILPEDRQPIGLQAVFNGHFPIEDSRQRYKLEFLQYAIDPPLHSIEECIAQGLTYSVPLKATLRLSSQDDEDEDDPDEAVEQEVYLGIVPQMTPRGSFVINGAERVVVSQLHRSPGVFFGQSTHANGTKLYSARVIPIRGTWIEFSTDVQNVLWVYLDRKKKLPVTTLLRGLGFSSTQEIVTVFNLADRVETHLKRLYRRAIKRTLAISVVVRVKTAEHIDEDTGEILEEEFADKVLFPAGHELTDEDYWQLKEHQVKEIFILRRDAGQEEAQDNTTLLKTLGKDPTNNQEQALQYIYKRLRETDHDAPDIDVARRELMRMFSRIDLGEVGRHRINHKLEISLDEDASTLDAKAVIDIVVAISKRLVALRSGEGSPDDIDHLGNRRVRTVGEQLGQQYSLGLARMARTIRERMNLRDADRLTPQDLVNERTVRSVINTYFGTSQLSQFMDQTNPLSELTHKRRMSALGPGGLTRERAGFEVRDVHYTHYGRLCPIETPEGPNIGLISSLCVHARINSFGFIETPYRQVVKGRVTNKITYLSAEEEDEAIIAQANARIDARGRFLDERVRCRYRGDFPTERPADIQYMDISPNQIVSPSASIIPFLEHDDANRALMGSNMQRQAVPLLRAEAPIVGTGLEHRVARDSRAVIVAEGHGTVKYVDSTRIIVKYRQTEAEKGVSFDEPEREYKLIKFRRTNQDTCINQKPIVKVGQRVKPGMVLTDGFSTDKGELALGKNVLVAFMPWRGYNFEDAIVLSERLVSEDVFTSIHIEQFELQVRDTKRGHEELTREIPNVSEEATRDLDERGIVRVGAEVKAGDIIVGKITPKGETDPTPEEKLLRAIFGDKAGDVKDASLKAPPGMNGVVIDTKLFSRRKLDPASKKMEQLELAKIEERKERAVKVLHGILEEKFFALAIDRVSGGIWATDGSEVVPPETTIKREHFAETSIHELDAQRIALHQDAKGEKQLRVLFRNYQTALDKVTATAKRDEHRVKLGDELPAGVVQMARVYVAKERKIQVGDKMAGRHGNKGVVARIVPIEDMPFMEDGTPVDIVLNPLGVPSRMNLGQIYETLLGWAGSVLGKRFAAPTFESENTSELLKSVQEAGLPVDGRAQLLDGRTGEPFDQKTTVGQIYMMKLSHLVDDKIHARSIGPYSLITQQPLGGKAQFGGQRLGEMEVWAMYAYGASNVLQEMLTYKSDDVQGRSKAYESVVKGENMPEAGIPESFNVLVRELRGLGLEIRLD